MFLGVNPKNATVTGTSYAKSVITTLMKNTVDILIGNNINQSLHV